MIGHCTINGKPKPKEGMKFKRVEFENRGYWAKWYLAYDVKHVKELFKADYPDGKYSRCRFNALQRGSTTEVECPFQTTIQIVNCDMQ